MFKRKSLAALALVAGTLASASAWASPPGCVGKFWNPATDIDYSLIGALKVAGTPLMKSPANLGEPPEHRTNPTCACADGLNSGVGFGMTFWLPSYAVDVARQAGCIGFLNGTNILPSFISLSSSQESTIHKLGTEGSTNMQIHKAHADILAIAGKSVFEECNAIDGEFAIEYLTEVDFVFQNDLYSAIMSPHVALLAKVPILSQMACGVEAMANTLGDWRDLGICGWNGTRLPLSANSISKASAQVTNMDVVLKYFTRAALLGTQLRTTGDGVVCKPVKDVKYLPFQHRYQWSFPNKTATRYNVDMVRWGMAIRDNGGGTLSSLQAQTNSLAGINTTTPPSTTGGGAGGAASLASSVLAGMPKPLNFPTREAGYMQVWEARQCCLKVLTLKSMIAFLAGEFISEIKQVTDLYNTFNVLKSAWNIVNGLGQLAHMATGGMGAAGGGAIVTAGEAGGAAAATGGATSGVVSGLTESMTA